MKKLTQSGTPKKVVAKKAVAKKSVAKKSLPATASVPVNVAPKKVPGRIVVPPSIPKFIQFSYQMFGADRGVIGKMAPANGFKPVGPPQPNPVPSPYQLVSVIEIGRDSDYVVELAYRVVSRRAR